jgi:hypothetical protein
VVVILCSGLGDENQTNPEFNKPLSFSFRISHSQFQIHEPLPAAAKPPGEDGSSVLCRLSSVLRSTEHLPVSNGQNATLNRYRDHKADSAGKGTDAADDTGDGG